MHVIGPARHLADQYLGGQVVRFNVAAGVLDFPAQKDDEGCYDLRAFPKAFPAYLNDRVWKSMLRKTIKCCLRLATPFTQSGGVVSVGPQRIPKGYCPFGDGCVRPNLPQELWKRFEGSCQSCSFKPGMPFAHIGQIVSSPAFD
jgi:hypothetical protein